MLKLREAIVVEGRYDKNTLMQIVDTVIVATDGFQIFKNDALLSLLRRLARERGLIIFTDSDGGGLVIRSYLKGVLPPDEVKHAYIPDRPGKEKRKRQPGKEGKLGVEGMPPEVLEEALRHCGATVLGETQAETLSRREITKMDFFRDGLTGATNAAKRRQALLARLSLPANLSANALLSMLNTFIEYETYCMLVEEINDKGDKL